MAKTYTKLVYHIVFSTKERMPLITGEIRERLYPYLGGVIRGEKGSLMEIGGVADHVHILARFGAVVAVSEMVKRIKGSSSHWVSQEVGSWFAWQVGSGGASQAGVVQGRAHLPPAETRDRSLPPPQDPHPDPLPPALPSTGRGSHRPKTRAGRSLNGSPSPGWV
jgi:REP element-mobilizing transposase RayT